MVTRTLSSLLLFTAIALGSCSLLNNSETAQTTPAEDPAPSETIEPVASPPEAAGNVLVGSDGASQITLPEGWTEDRELHDSAEIQASRRDREMYVIVLSESKQDFQDLTLEQHSEITRGLLQQSLTDAAVTGPTGVNQINGNPAVQYEIRGAIEGINVAYLHTTVETPNNFHQVLAWTLPSNFERNQAELEQVIQSFSETNTAAPDAETAPAPAPAPAE